MMMMNREPTWSINFTNPCDFDQEVLGDLFNFSSPEPEDQYYAGADVHRHVHPHAPILLTDDESFDLENLCDEYQIIQSLGGEFDDQNWDWVLNNNHGDDNSPLLITSGESVPGVDDGEFMSPSISVESADDSWVMNDGNIQNMELVDDDQLSLFHLLKAYGEAVENGEKDLAEVISSSVTEKSSATGNTTQRVAFNLFHSRQNQGEFLRQESVNNFVEALMVFYKTLPLGRFAHFTANSIILEAIPDDAATVHVVDFDIGEGIQWPPLIEALARRRHKPSLKITCMKFEQNSCWGFEETKKRLQIHARECGLKLKMEEKSTKDFAAVESAKLKEKNQLLVFNCLAGFSHMGRRRPRAHVMEFLKVAQECVASCNGILTLGQGEELGLGVNSCSSFKAFFDQLLGHYHTLFEVLERSFPTYLGDARTAMETLFLGPFMNTWDWFKDWEEMRKGSVDMMRLEGRQLSQESLAESVEMVNHGGAMFQIRREGCRQHEIVLEWQNTPLVRISSWH